MIDFFRQLFNRPMIFMEMRFIDKVSGKEVNLYLDKYGQEWLATSCWGWDRIKK